MLRRREAIDEGLPQVVVLLGPRELARRKLHQALGRADLDPHRAVVRHPQEAAVAQRADRRKARRAELGRKGPERRLGLDFDLAVAFDRPAEPHI